MNTDNTLDILKMAILMEKRGMAFYSKVAEQASDPEIGEIFKTMAAEEALHLKFLSDQFLHFDVNKVFSLPDLMDPATEGIVNNVLSDEVKKKISAAGYEAAAISAAIDMEKKAVEVYAGQANVTSDLNEKKLYEWLANWEKGHLKILHDLDDELKEKIWYDRQFWPF